MEKYVYELTIQRQINQVLQAPDFSQYKAITDYLDYHNNICPRCGEEMKIYNNEIKNIGAIGVSVFKKEEVFVPYGICKKCVKNLSKEADFLKRQKADKLDEILKLKLEIK